MMQRRSNFGSLSQRGALLTVALLLFGLMVFIPKAAWASTTGCLTTPAVTVSATGVAFGNYNVMNAADTPGTGSVTVSSTCNIGFLTFTVNYTIALNTGSSGSFTPRSMASGSNKLQYNLYTSASLTTIWGDGTGGTQTVAGTTTANCGFLGSCTGSTSSTVYGNLPAMQNVVAGSYSDTITVTVAF